MPEMGTHHKLSIGSLRVTVELLRRLSARTTSNKPKTHATKFGRFNLDDKTSLVIEQALVLQVLATSVLSRRLGDNSMVETACLVIFFHDLALKWKPILMNS